MKILISLFFALTFFYFAGCGDDNPLNNNVNDPSIIFQMDSLSSWIPANGNNAGNSFDFIIDDSASLQSVKIEFRFQTNLNSICMGQSDASLQTADTVINIYIMSLPLHPVDSLISSVFDLSNKTSRVFRFSIFIQSNPNPAPGFIRFKDIKVSKI